MTELFLEIFDPERKKVFNKLAAFVDHGYLAGGTALALQLSHRKSFDFDIFIPKPLSRHFVKKIVNVFGKEITARVNTSDFFFFETEQNIEMNFVYYWYERVQSTIKTKSISLASVEDIAADKAYTIGRRGQWRDYVDIFFLLKMKLHTLEQIIQLADKKFKPEFAPRLFLEQLTYYGDIKNFEIHFLKKEYGTAEIKNFLTQEARKL